MCLLKAFQATSILTTSALSLAASVPTSQTSTQSSENENGANKETGLTWWQILLLVIGGFLVFTCWGCYFFFRHREKQQAKFKPVATSNGDDPRVRTDSNTVNMEPPRPRASPDKPEHVQNDHEEQEDGVEVNPDKQRVVAQDEIVIENSDVCQAMASTSEYHQTSLREDRPQRSGSCSRYVEMDDDDLEYQ